MEALKELAADGHTIVTAIHQPRSRIFELFDDLLLLSAGTPVFSGAASAALPHFEALGHTCPPHHNPAEFLADLISHDNASEESTAASRNRLDRLAANAPSALRTPRPAPMTPPLPHLHSAQTASQQATSAALWLDPWVHPAGCKYT